MHDLLKSALLATAVTVATPALAEITFFEREDFSGNSFTTSKRVGDFSRRGFNDLASSTIVVGDRWEVCDDRRFSGRCVVLRPGRYDSLAAMGMNNRLTSARTIPRNARIDERRYAPLPVAGNGAEIVFFEREAFSGRSFVSGEAVGNFARRGFNDRASSVEVVRGNWEVCDDVRFGGRCALLRPGRYPSLAAMGLDNRISSARGVGREVFASHDQAPPAAVYNARRRDNEQLYEADVTAVRAVLGTPEQKCWVEREAVPQESSRANIPAAIAGAVIGGILGHQVGGGSGRNIATAGGAIAGAAIGANVGRDGGSPAGQVRDVQRCSETPSQTRPDYWDVSYNFRGQEHRIQMTVPPGPTVTVNERGEPRA